MAATLNLIEFFARESCGWCTPCREGLPYVETLLRAIENGEGKEAFIPMLKEMCGHMKLAYCAFAEGAAAPVLRASGRFFRRGPCPYQRKEMSL